MHPTSLLAIVGITRWLREAARWMNQVAVVKTIRKPPAH
jgi:hypothetical protein